MLIVKSILSLLAGLLLSYASLLFFHYNRPIIKNPFLLLLLFENGAVESDERIALVRIQLLE